MDRWEKKQGYVKDDLTPGYRAYWEAVDKLSTVMDEPMPRRIEASRGPEQLLAWWREMIELTRGYHVAGYALCLEEIQKLMAGG